MKSSVCIIGVWVHNRYSVVVSVVIREIYK